MTPPEPTIRITYLAKGAASPVVLDLTPQAYYDPIGDGESYGRDGVPKFDHAWQYTPHRARDLLWTVLEVDAAGGDRPTRTVIRTQLLDGTRSMMTHRADADGYEEIIHSTEIDPGRWHIVRTSKPAGCLWSVTMNNLTEEGSGTREPGPDFCGCWSCEQRLAFCEVRGTH